MKRFVSKQWKFTCKSQNPTKFFEEYRVVGVNVNLWKLYIVFKSCRFVGKKGQCHCQSQNPTNFFEKGVGL